jgi:hypothetical protein
MNPIFYPKYWLGLYMDDYPAYAWTDGYTPGPDVFSKASAGAYYTHWGSFMWVVAAAQCISSSWTSAPTLTQPPPVLQVCAGRAQQPRAVRGGRLPAALLHQRHQRPAVWHTQHRHGMGLERPGLQPDTPLRVHEYARWGCEAGCCGSALAPTAPMPNCEVAPVTTSHIKMQPMHQSPACRR